MGHRVKTTEIEYEDKRDFVGLKNNSDSVIETLRSIKGLTLLSSVPGGYKEVK